MQLIFDIAISAVKNFVWSFADALLKNNWLNFLLQVGYFHRSAHSFFFSTQDSILRYLIHPYSFLHLGLTC